jgi:hypothetical protein
VEWAFCVRSRRAISFIVQSPLCVPPMSHRRLDPGLPLKDSLLTWDDDPGGSMQACCPRYVALDLPAGVS